MGDMKDRSLDRYSEAQGDAFDSALSEQKEGLSRRNFIKGASLFGAAALTVGGLAACAPADNAGDGKADDVATGIASLPTTWDKEVEVLAVGTSGAAYGALAAVDAGAASVLLIEKYNMFGGTTALSGGGHWTPCNKVMAEQGIDDTMDDAMAYMRWISMGQSSEELMKSYIENSNAFVDWTSEKFGYVWELMMGGGTYQDYAPDSVPGTKPKGRSIAIENVATMKAVTGEDVEKGYMAAAFEFRCLRHLLEQNNVEILMETEAVKLYKDETGTVVGAQIRSTGGGEEQNVKASKGVILGTGGFDYNQEMCRAFLHIPYYSSCQVPTNTGDGHRMGMEVGANLANMASTYGCATYLPKSGPLEQWQMLEDPMLLYNQTEAQRGKPNSIIVNSKGQRIGNESSAYGVFIRALEAWDTSTIHPMNIPAYLIVDSTWTAHYSFKSDVALTPLPVGEIPDYVIEAGSIEELADKLGIDKDGLVAQVAEFNQYAADGLDPIWHRGEYQHDLSTAGDTSGKRTDLKNICVAPVETAPFYGTPIYPGVLGTSGGLKINGKAQVLDVYDQPIAGLFACGCTACSPFGPAYPGGGGPVGSTCTMGYVAGRVAMGAEVK